MKYAIWLRSIKEVVLCPVEDEINTRAQHVGTSRDWLSKSLPDQVYIEDLYVRLKPATGCEKARLVIRVVAPVRNSLRWIGDVWPKGRPCWRTRNHILLANYKVSHHFCLPYPVCSQSRSSRTKLALDQNYYCWKDSIISLRHCSHRRIANRFSYMYCVYRVLVKGSFVLSIIGLCVPTSNTTHKWRRKESKS